MMKRNGTAWAVLIVGGLPDEVRGHAGRPWADPGGQVGFLETLGAVYDSMLEKVGKDRIIVVAGLSSTLDWLRSAEALGHPPCAPEHAAACRASVRATTPEKADELRAKYGERLRSVGKACRQLLAHGGADYDRGSVTPETVLGVLSGRPARPGGKVLPATGVASCFVWTTSHGGHHPVHGGAAAAAAGVRSSLPLDAENRVEGSAHKPVQLCQDNEPCPRSPAAEAAPSLRTDEFFFSMPFPSASRAAYGPVTSRHLSGDPSAGPPPGAAGFDPLACVYWQQVVAAVAPSCAGGRRLVFLH
ncbi:hypothetical protein DIPPA_30778 [Diplonema papillatum]|nr:hypothetical protein DIPPA_30778 [Diplonema papillatum]